MSETAQQTEKNQQMTENPVAGVGSSQPQAQQGHGDGAQEKLTIANLKTGSHVLPEVAAVNNALTVYLDDTMKRREEKTVAGILYARADSRFVVDMDKMSDDEKKTYRNGANIPYQILDDMIDARRQVLPHRIKEITELQKLYPDGIPGHPDFINPRISEIESKYDQAVIDIVRAKHYNRSGGVNKELLDTEVNSAFNLVDGYIEKENKSVTSKVTKSVYDKEKGGLQTGGVIGAVLGFIAGSVFAPANGIMGLILGLVGAVLGAYVGNTMFDNKNPAYKGAATPPPRGKSNGQEKSEGKGQELEKGQDTGAGKQETIGSEKKHVTSLQLNATEFPKLGGVINVPEAESNQLAGLPNKSQNAHSNAISGTS